MRIAYISYEYPPDSANGGIATYVRQAALMMRDRGHEVEVFAASGTRQGRFWNEGILEHWIPEIDRMDFGVVAGHWFEQRHREAAFDVIEGPEYFADARKAVSLVTNVALVVKMHTPSKLIFELNNPCASRPNHKFILRGLYRLVLDLVRHRALRKISLAEVGAIHEIDFMESQHTLGADLVGPPCQALCDYAAKSWMIPQERIRFSPHPYSPSHELLNIAPDDGAGKVVGFIGRLERRKGIEVLAVAIPMVLRAVPSARFRLIGATNFRPQTEKTYADWLKVELSNYLDRVDIIGKIPLDEMPNVYEGLNVCVFPSLWENFPNVCLEAMAAGRAIVASPSGGMAEMLDQGKTGRLAESGNPRALADEIIHLLSSPTERNSLGLAARHRVLESYNKEVIGHMMEQIYLEAMDKKIESLRKFPRSKTV